MKNALNRFRLIALLEGISFVVLLFIAMPLKYFADWPLAVKYTGWMHGVLFMLYIVALAHAALVYRWSFFKIVAAFIASLIPFGTFYLDSRLQKDVITYS